MVARVIALRAHPAFGQLVRFVVAGLGVTALSVAAYLLLAVSLHVPPMVANVASHFVGVASGYAVHSRWSFRDAGPRDPGTIVKFVIVSGVSFALNSSWVFLATAVFALPAWAPVPAMVCVTPLASFALNRIWVFGRA